MLGAGRRTGPGAAGGAAAAGERTAIVGCGTSYYMAQAAAVLREEAGQGETDAFPASEFPTTAATTGSSR